MNQHIARATLTLGLSTKFEDNKQKHQIKHITNNYKYIISILLITILSQLRTRNNKEDRDQEWYDYKQQFITLFSSSPLLIQFESCPLYFVLLSLLHCHLTIFTLRSFSYRDPMMYICSFAILYNTNQKLKRDDIFTKI